MTRSFTAVGRAIGRRIASAPPALVLAVAWIVLVIYAFPGQMTQDSWDHLTEARRGIYTDGHPPAMDLLFRWADYVIPGPFLLLVVQSAALLLGLHRVLRRALSERGAAWATLGCYLYPPVMLVMVVIWKDCVMAGFLALGIGALLDDRRWVRVLALAALVVASAVRYNAFAATLPAVVLLFEWRPGAPWLRRYAISFCAWLAITLAAFAINRALTDRPMYLWQSTLAVYDIVGTLNYVDGEASDAELEQLLAGTDLRVHRDIHKTMRALYSPTNFIAILVDPTHPLWSLPINGTEPAPEPVRDAVTRAWWGVVTRHPGAYLRHRLAVTGAVLSLGHMHAAGVVTRRDAFRYFDVVHQMGLGTGWSPLQDRWTHAMNRLARGTPLFAPWLYLLASLVLIALALRQRDALAILLSGVVYEATLVPLAASHDYRYSHWMILTTCVAAILVIARRRAARSPAPVVPGERAR
ncbi:MAG TPA: hypothetical protein VFT22_18310 [Kofleriaceae bacterium]|nr:hypothetical protein [Kofleriaceae bacterium]